MKLLLSLLSIATTVTAGPGEGGEGFQWPGPGPHPMGPLGPHGPEGPHGHHHHAPCLGGDCLKSCKSCGQVDNLGEERADNSSVFTYGSRVKGDCIQAICSDSKAVMLVDGQVQKSLVCFQGKWHYGFPSFLEETPSATCVSPGSLTCDVNAAIVFDNPTFICKCNNPYIDVSPKFAGNGQVCSNCDNTMLNVVILMDRSGSMTSVFSSIKTFIGTFMKFINIRPNHNRAALMRTGNSYVIEVKWADSASTNEAAFMTKVNAIDTTAQSNIGTGLQAVKAEFVQTMSDPPSGKTVVIVFTDGSVIYSPPNLADISNGAQNLYDLGVEVYAVVTNGDHSDKVNAIVNQFSENVFQITPGANNFEVANALQRKICAPPPGTPPPQ